MNNFMSFILTISPLAVVGESLNVTAHVYDDLNNPVTGACVRIWTEVDSNQGFKRSPKYNYYESLTSADGMASLTFPCYSASFRSCAFSDQHYKEDGGRLYLKFRQKTFSSVDLLEHDKEISFVLRRRKNPIRMIYSQVYSSCKPFEKEGEYGFDLMKGDWLPPNGIGETADFYVYSHGVSTNNLYPFAEGGILFRDPGNGAYICKKVKTTSGFDTEYEANSNATYQTVIPSRSFQVKGYGLPLYYSKVLQDDEYMVMRTRTKLDGNGNIRTAHYSVLLGSVDAIGKFGHRGYRFNPTPNDPNLEIDIRASTDLERKYRNKQRSVPRINNTMHTK